MRGLIFIGLRYTCPCCGWRFRAFTHGGVSFRMRHLGYCPRCHSKARHRRIWLFLEQKTNLFSGPLRLLHVSPEYCFSRRFKKMHNLDYVGADIYDYPNITIKMDLVEMPIRSDTFDAIICIHVLEHIEDDRSAIKELFRVLKPGGWAVVSVPIRWDQKTYEDPRIISEEDRERAFGEIAHVRIYGYDLVDRLEECGFKVQPDLGKDVEQQTREKYGLRDDENIFYCTKARIVSKSYERMSSLAVARSSSEQ
jgi:SAM-dependent methyltransferase